MSLLGIGTTIAGGAYNEYGNQRQNRQDRTNAMMQYQNQRKLNQQGNRLQMDMWNKTNYGAQVDHMKEAGLNPALMYGSAGQGGTTGSQGGGSATKAQAPKAPVMDMSNMLMDAQIAKLKASAKKDIADATKTGGVDTDLGNANIEGVKQNVLESVARTSKIDSEVKLNKALLELKNAEVSRAKKGTQKGDIIGNILELWGLDPVNNENDRLLLQGAITAKYGAGLFKDIMQAIYSKRGFNVEGDNVNTTNNNNFPRPQGLPNGG
jgi:hypothetical protein